MSEKFKIKLFFFLSLLGFLILFFLIQKDFFLIKKIIKQENIKFIIYLFISFIILSNIQCVRFFFNIRYLSKCNIKFINWGKVYFYSCILNFGIPFLGHIYRSNYLKKLGFGYKNYISLNYFIGILVVIINLILIFSEVLFLKFDSFIFFLIPVIIFYLFIFSPFFLSTVGEFLKKFYFLSYKFVVVAVDILSVIIIYIKNINNITLFIIFTILIHFFELLAFGITSYLIIDDINLIKIIYLFFISFLFTRIQLFSNIFGLNEILTGQAAVFLGLYFTEGLLVQLLLRISNYLITLFNYIIYFLIALFKKHF
jgi:hypothetical protein